MLIELSVPFDTNTIYGWYSLLVLLICTDLAYFVSLILGTTQFVGSCIYIAAICEHFDAIMQTVQANVEKYRNEKDPWEYKKLRANINSQIHKAVRIHSGIYEWVLIIQWPLFIEENDHQFDIFIFSIFETVSQINSVSIFVILPPNTVILGITLYQIHQVTYHVKILQPKWLSVLKIQSNFCVFYYSFLFLGCQWSRANFYFLLCNDTALCRCLAIFILLFC